MKTMNPKAKVALMASMLGTAVAGNAAAADVPTRITAVKPAVSSTTTISAALLLKYQQLKQFLIAPMSN
jgi:hypothetical protein